MNIKKAFRNILEALEATVKREDDIEQRLDAIETAIGDLQGTREITDVPLTDKLIENEVRYTFTLPLGTLQDTLSWQRPSSPYDVIGNLVLGEQEFTSEEG